MSWAQGNEEPHKAAVRTSIGALKRCNGRGAKGRRKMERRGKHMSEQNLTTVTPAKEPKQDKEALRARWKWVERAVWTDPMLRPWKQGSKEERVFDEAGLFNLTAARVTGR